MNQRFLKLVKRVYYRYFKLLPSASPVQVEKAEKIFYINYLQEGMIVFDVGANIGELSLMFSRFIGKSGQLHAFEPSQAMFKNLTQLCQLTRRNNIALNYNAVADKKGVLSLHVYDDEHSTWNSLANRPLYQYGIDIKPIHVEEVEAITIDDYCQENNIAQIDLLKIDVEGAEYQVLLGARRMLESSSIRCCVFEFGATTFDMGNDPNEIEAYLKQFGYSIQNVVKGDPVFPGRSSADQARFSVHVARPQR